MNKVDIRNKTMFLFVADTIINIERVHLSLPLPTPRGTVLQVCPVLVFKRLLP